MLDRLARNALQLVDGVGHTFGIRALTEEPRSESLARFGDVEIRRYGARWVAETVVPGGPETARSEGFERLAGYIFGGNSGGERLAMTAPVAQTGERIPMTAPVTSAAGPEGWTIRFFMPAGRDGASLPRPRDPRVTLAEVPGQTVAVLRYAGVGDASAVKRREGELMRRLESSGWRIVGPIEAWFYDPPWTLPPLRRNEVAAPVEKG